MSLLEDILFSVINNLGTPSSELQTNFGLVLIDTENSATGILFNSLVDLKGDRLIGREASCKTV